MKSKTVKVLPKTMMGTVHAQYMRCGKKSCKCSRGELHGAYYYHFVRVGSKLRKRYLKASEAEETIKACILRQSQDREQRERNRSQWELFRELRTNLRKLKDLYQQPEEF